MSVSQITLIVENTPGRISGLSELMGAEALNIRALSVSDRGESSVLRFIVEDPKRAANALSGKGFQFTIDEVLAVEIPDHPGALGAVLKPLKEKNINVDFMYPAIGRHGQNAILIIGVNNIDKAAEVLKANYITLLGDEVYNL